MPLLTNKAKAADLFIRAAKAEERGDLRSAFRLLLFAAKLGDIGAQLDVGNYYDSASGVRRNRAMV
jgi:TPR repeat protein